MQLPRDVWFTIAFYLPVSSIKQFALTCRLFTSVLDKIYWKLRLTRDYKARPYKDWTYAYTYQRHYRYKSGKCHIIEIPLSISKIDKYDTTTVSRYLKTHGVRRGDLVISDSYRYIYDGKCITTSLRGMHVIEEFEPSFWDGHNWVYSVYFDPTPYRLELIANACKTPPYITHFQTCMSHIIDWRGIKRLFIFDCKLDEIANRLNTIKQKGLISRWRYCKDVLILSRW